MILQFTYMYMYDFWHSKEYFNTEMQICILFICIFFYFNLSVNPNQFLETCRISDNHPISTLSALIYLCLSNLSCISEIHCYVKLLQSNPF